MKENAVKITLAAVVGGLSAYLGVIAIPLIVLIAVMVTDYITGMAKAYINAQLSSRIGIRGIIKKLCYFFAVVCAGITDWVLSIGASKLGIDIGLSLYIGLIVTIWLIINELISIIENLSAIGVPLPEFLNKMIKRLKITVENKGKEIGEDGD